MVSRRKELTRFKFLEKVTYFETSFDAADLKVNTLRIYDFQDL